MKHNSYICKKLRKMLQIEDVSGYEGVELKNDQLANDYAKERTGEPNLLSVLGFSGFGLAIFLTLVRIIAEPFVATVIYPVENDAMPGLANIFGLVFLLFWFICATILLYYILFRVSYKCLKEFK
jgi:hypothetical protein